MVSQAATMTGGMGKEEEEWEHGFSFWEDHGQL